VLFNFHQFSICRPTFVISRFLLFQIPRYTFIAPDTRKTDRAQMRQMRIIAGRKSTMIYRQKAVFKN